ncbi:MAG: 2-phospho-L-lactate guanylyltransferase [Gammaproteobacteria bacterium]|nr:2-phospho-L-lactate guanylyltransferase [Gammaproteobacteria bacterium]
MTNIIIPIKNLSFAKTRLASVLTSSMRSQLVLAMLEDLLRTVSKLEHERIWVVASNDAVFDIARNFGALPIRENCARGYNSAVTLGFAVLSENDNVAVLPGDVPLARGDEIASLIAPPNQDRPTIRLAPAHDRQGTNGMFLSRKNLISPGFGFNSFNRYVNAIRGIGIEPEVLDTPCLAHDIDTPRDLSEFASLCADGTTGEFLRTADIPVFDLMPKEGMA